MWTGLVAERRTERFVSKALRATTVKAKCKQPSLASGASCAVMGAFRSTLDASTLDEQLRELTRRPPAASALPPTSALSSRGFVASSGTLPAGWREVTSEQGDLFFYCEATGVSQWEHPAPPPAPLPAPPPAPPPALQPPQPASPLQPLQPSSPYAAPPTRQATPRQAARLEELDPPLQLVAATLPTPAASAAAAPPPPPSDRDLLRRDRDLLNPYGAWARREGGRAVDERHWPTSQASAVVGAVESEASRSSAVKLVEVRQQKQSDAIGGKQKLGEVREQRARRGGRCSERRSERLETFQALSGGKAPHWAAQQAMPFTRLPPPRAAAKAAALVAPPAPTADGKRRHGQGSRPPSAKPSSTAHRHRRRAETLPPETTAAQPHAPPHAPPHAQRSPFMRPSSPLMSPAPVACGGPAVAPYGQSSEQSSEHSSGQFSGQSSGQFSEPPSEPTAEDFEAALHLEAVLNHIYGDLTYDAINTIADGGGADRAREDGVPTDASRGASLLGSPPLGSMLPPPSPQTPPHHPPPLHPPARSPPGRSPGAGGADTFSQRPVSSAHRRRKPGCGDAPVRSPSRSPANDPLAPPPPTPAPQPPQAQQLPVGRRARPPTRQIV